MSSNRKKRKTGDNKKNENNNSGSRPAIDCSYYKECLEVKQAINLPDILLDLDSTSNSCFCHKCHEGRDESYAVTQGPEPDNLYTRPRGWGRMMLKLPPRAEHLKVMENWNVAYHGTSLDKLLHIVEGGELLLPGDQTISGELIEKENDDNNDDDDDTKEFILAPSIKYAGCDAFAKRKKVYLPISGRYVYVRTVLQVCVKPDRFITGPESIGRSDPIDPPINNDCIEWSTDARNCIIPTAILVQVLESPGPEQSSVICPTCRVLFGGNNQPATKTCRHQHVLCKSCFTKFQDIHGQVCVLCMEPVYYSLDLKTVEKLTKSAQAYVTAHDRIASKEEKLIAINVFTKTGKRIISICISPVSTIFRVKREIERREGIPPDQQRLFLGEQLLEEQETLSDYGIGHGDRLILVLRLRGN